MKVTSAEFVTSAVKPDQYPPPELPEIAFAGRSNVGKSSLINTLVNRKRLVKTSRTPGRTQLINFFRVNNRVSFVDLPGYGYAKVPDAVKKQWGPMIETYLARRESLRGVVVLLDIRRTPRHEERNLMTWMDQYRLPYVPVLTKTDKLSKNQQMQQRAATAKMLSVSAADLILFSAKTRQGRDELWATLSSLVQQEENEDESHE